MRIIRTQQRQQHTELVKFDTENPYQLAFELLNLQTQLDEQLYPKRMRLSNISKACPRESVLGFRHELELQTRLGIQQRTTFDLGNAFHEWMQNTPAYFGNRRVGWWQCMACGHVRFGYPPKAKCQCGAAVKAIRYKEHYMRLDNPLVSGHPDLFYAVTKDDVRVMELKTVNGDEFKKLTAPLSDHVFQVNGYMHYLRMDKTLPIRLNGDTAFIIYASKQHTVTTIPYKAFLIKRSAEIVAVIEKMLEEFTQGINDTAYLPSLLAECEQTGWNCARARRCPVLDYCKEEKA